MDTYKFLTATEGRQRYDSLPNREFMMVLLIVATYSQFGVHQPAVPTEYCPWQTQMRKKYRHTVPVRRILNGTFVLLGYFE